MKHASFRRQSGDRRLRQHRPGRPAADPPPHRHAGASASPSSPPRSAATRKRERYGIRFVVEPLTRDNYRAVLEPLLGAGDFLLNLSVDVSSVALIEFAQETRRALPRHLHRAVGRRLHRSDAVAVAALQLRAARERAGAAHAATPAAPTAVLTHGANPGLVSHFVKEALLNIARDTGVEAADADRPARVGGARPRLGVKVIHIAERDTQVAEHAEARRASSSTPGRSTASSAKAASRPNWAGARTSSTSRTTAARHDFGCGAAIYLERPGAGTRVRTWTPLEGPFHGFLVTHNEVDLDRRLLHGARTATALAYRPTVHYAYHPCDDAVLSLHELAGKNWRLQPEKRLMMDEIASGIDELGVLLMGHAKGAYWYGSRLSIEEARRARSLQQRHLAAGHRGGAGRHGLGDREPARRHRRAGRAWITCAACRSPGRTWARWSASTPTGRRCSAAACCSRRSLDPTCPWQFKNFRVL